MASSAIPSCVVIRPIRRSCAWAVTTSSLPRPFSGGRAFACTIRAIWCTGAPCPAHSAAPSNWISEAFPIGGRLGALKPESRRPPLSSGLQPGEPAAAVAPGGSGESSDQRRSITGPWSRPTFLNGAGWDPSLFHDEDGRTYLTNMVVDHRPGRVAARGDRVAGAGPRRRNTAGHAAHVVHGHEAGLHRGDRTSTGKTAGTTCWSPREAPRGTTRSRRRARRSLDGPFAADPRGPLLTSAGEPSWPLQKAGHGSLVRRPRASGTWRISAPAR